MKTNWKRPSPTPSGFRVRLSRPAILLGLYSAILGATGCANPLKPPIRIGVTSLDLSPLPPFLPKRVLFEQDLAGYLQEPISFDPMTPRQIRVHLGTGRLKFAMLSPADYAEIVPADTCRILAVPINVHSQTYRQGLIIVSPKSKTESLAQIKGLRFHFMPKGDVLNEAALGALVAAGVDSKSIDRGILGLELDTTHISSLEVAKSVVLEENAAGVIDEADYNSWPDHGGSLVLLSPSKEQVRVIGKTIRVPEGPVLVSTETPPELVEKMREYLLEVVGNRKLVIGTLGYNGFAPPIDPKEYEPYFEVRRKLNEMAGRAPEPQPSADPPESADSTR